MLPALRPHVEKNKTSTSSFEKLLVRRVEASCPASEEGYRWGRNELKTFETDIWQGPVNLVNTALRKQRVITLLDMAETSEKILSLKWDGFPAMYIRHNPELPHCVYIGETSNAAARNDGHLNSTLYLTDVKATVDKRTAANMQDMLINYALRKGAEPFRLQRRCKGLYQFPKGVNGFDVLTEYMQSNPEFGVLMRQSLKIKGNF